MNYRKLAKQLRREFVADPKKGVLLGLLGVVALWFWAPMVWGWIAPEEPVAEVTPVASTTPVTTESGPAAATNKTAAGQNYDWQKLVEWIENDPRTSPAELRHEGTFSRIWRWWPLNDRASSDSTSQQRDPFQIPQAMVAQVEAETEQEDEPEIAADVTPESLGLSLSGTLVGHDRAVARIGGRTYRTGNSIVLTNNGQQIVFQLMEVHPRRVVLQRDGSQFELCIIGPGASGQIELVNKAN